MRPDSTHAAPPPDERPHREAVRLAATEADDDELARRLLCERDAEAAAVLVDRYGPPLMGVLGRLLGGNAWAVRMAEQLVSGLVVEAAYGSLYGVDRFVGALRAGVREALERRAARYIEALLLAADDEPGRCRGLVVLMEMEPRDQVIAVCKTRERTGDDDPLTGLDGFLSAEQLAWLYDTTVANVRVRCSRADGRARRAATFED